MSFKICCKRIVCLLVACTWCVSGASNKHHSKDVCHYVCIIVYMYLQHTHTHTHLPGLIRSILTHATQLHCVATSFSILSHYTQDANLLSIFIPCSLFVCLFVSFARFPLTFALFGCLGSHSCVILFKGKELNALKSFRIA